MNYGNSYTQATREHTRWQKGSRSITGSIVLIEGLCTYDRVCVFKYVLVEPNRYSGYSFVDRQAKQNGRPLNVALNASVDNK